jgi:hypothetical protein
LIVPQIGPRGEETADGKEERREPHHPRQVEAEVGTQGNKREILQPKQVEAILRGAGCDGDSHSCTSERHRGAGKGRRTFEANFAMAMAEKTRCGYACLNATKNPSKAAEKPEKRENLNKSPRQHLLPLARRMLKGVVGGRGARAGLRKNIQKIQIALRGSVKHNVDGNGGGDAGQVHDGDVLLPGCAGVCGDGLSPAPHLGISFVQHPEGRGWWGVDCTMTLAVPHKGSRMEPAARSPATLTSNYRGATVSGVGGRVGRQDAEKPSTPATPATLG